MSFMLIITGTLAYDYIMDFPGVFSNHILPDQIHKINISFTAEKFERRFGGTAGNVSYNLGLLRTPHLLFSVAGRDFREYKRRLNKLGVDTNYVLEDKTAYTDSGFAMTDKKDNQIWGYFYGASKKIPQLKLKKIAKKDDFVLLGPSRKSGTISFIKQCIDFGLQYMFDPGFLLTDLTSNELLYGISHASHIVGNDYEITVMKKRIKDWQNVVSEKVVITTLGEKGSLVQTKKGTQRIKSSRPTNVVDPTGAGDAFRAGFLAGIDRGYDLVSSGQMGSAVASFAVEQYGAQEHTFTLKDLEERYRQTFGKKLNW